MVVVGGLGSISGAMLGAVFVYGVQYFLPPEYAFLATGAGLLLVLLLMPGGLGAAFGDARDGALRWYARRKGIRVPSLLADTLRRADDRPRPPSVVEALDEAAHGGARDRAAGARDERMSRSPRKPPTVWFTIRGVPVPHAAHAAPVLRRDERRRGAVPADRAVRPQRRRTSSTRPRSACSAPTSATRSTCRTRASSRSSRSRCSAACCSRSRSRTTPTGCRACAIAVIGAAVWGDLRHPHRALGHACSMLVIARIGCGHGPRGRHADAQLADLRLLPARGTRRRVRLPPRSASRSARSSARSLGGLLAHFFGWRVAVLRVRRSRRSSS